MTSIRYGPHAAQQLDLYLPHGNGPFPCVLWIHGGGWFTGNRSLATSAPQHRVLDAGFALASTGYRLSDVATFPAQLDDVVAATRALRSHPALDGAIAAWGESAGGHLAALLGVLRHVHAVVDWYGPTDFLAMDAQTRAQGCPEFNGGGHDAHTSPESRLMGFPIQQRAGDVSAANPIALIEPGDLPRFLIQHGDRDCTVPTAQSVTLHDALRAAGAHAELDILPAGHGGAAFNSAANLERVLAFLRASLAP